MADGASDVKYLPRGLEQGLAIKYSLVRGHLCSGADSTCVLVEPTELKKQITPGASTQLLQSICT